MVNILTNITALAGAATLVNIVDFKKQVLDLSNSFAINGNPIISFPEGAGQTNQAWLLTPQATAGTFTLQSVAAPSFSVSYTGAAAGVAQHSQAVASNTLATVFKMTAVGNGTVNLIDTVTGTALTSWVNANPGNWNDPTTPITMEVLNAPPSFMQSFTVQSI
ncbi:hypothetical protein MVEN_02325400 [Mycena venus]|uniref:Uncharacterized protein n=1 Tax=Mycena venus TaxID=2733690 RepID=A0A8H6X3D1_9AGAR|nr:hypothetical protein MVEN_02325400 [Mycena venus]